MEWGAALSSPKVMKFWVEGFFRRVSIVIEGVVPVTAKVFVAPRDRCDEGVPVTAKVFGDQPVVPVTARVVFFWGSVCPCYCEGVCISVLRTQCSLRGVCISV